MVIEIKPLSIDMEDAYERLLQESSVAMFNHSLQYRDFLRDILPDSEDHYLCACEGNHLLAALPVFIKRGSLGAVINSLPFYGSHGGIVSRPNLDKKILNDLFEALNDLCKQMNAISCTVIESPWETDKDRYSNYDAELFDERIGQITHLPDGSDVHVKIVEDLLLSHYHQKTRNMVRKGLKSGFEVDHDGSSATLNSLYTIHDENIRGIGGFAKPLSVFQAIQRVFDYDKDYRIYTACKDGRIVSAMLLFYFKDTVEYFCPATLENYRSLQPLSLLIFRAMQDAVVERGARYWNWGGTWLSQDGVYRFKSRWGAKNFNYKYYIKFYSNITSQKKTSKEYVLSSYPYFYVLPFSELSE